MANEVIYVEWWDRMTILQCTRLFTNSPGLHFASFRMLFFVTVAMAG